MSSKTILLFAGVLLTVLSFNGIASAQKRNVSTWLQSPRITDKGVWGPEDLCPEGYFVTGFRLKVDQDHGVFLDDTALNGIELSCNAKDGSIKSGNSEKLAPAYIKSLEGALGSWGTYFDCPNGNWANGFDLRSEGPQLVDNTGANNLALYCGEGAAGSRLEGNGMGWGDWTGMTNCPRGLELCGIKTQVAEQMPIPADNTALNNVDMACCEV